jgi:hypothetical protein
VGGQRANSFYYYGFAMPFPIKICVICSEEFELKPDKPGFANRCPECSAAEADDLLNTRKGAVNDRADSEMNEARRHAIRDLLYRKDS